MADKHWYFRLNRTEDGIGLLDRYSESDMSGNLIIAKRKDERLVYTKFDSYVEYYHHDTNFPGEYHEITCGTHNQKPRFDIDCAHSECGVEDPVLVGKQLVECILRGVDRVFGESDIKLNPLTDILIYSSHGPEKQSYHIVINRWYHAGSAEARAFADLVYSTIDHEYKHLIDMGIYSAKHPLRILGCFKVGTTRKKIFNRVFTYNNIQYTHEYIEPIVNYTHEDLTILSESLITFCHDCTKLRSWVIPKTYSEDDIDISDDQLAECVEMMMSQMDAPFEIGESRLDGLVTLIRQSPSHCVICNRIHEHEHPYMWISKLGNVYWNCRRSASMFLLGTLMSATEAGRICSRNEICDIEKISITDLISTLHDFDKILNTRKPKPQQRYTRQEYAEVLRELPMA